MPSKTGTKSSAVHSVQSTFPINARTYIYDVQEWNQIRERVYHIIKRVDEELPKKTTANAIKSSLKNLKNVMNAHIDILDTLQTFEVAYVNQNVCDFLKYLENQKIISNPIYRNKVQKYLDTLKAKQISLANKLLTIDEYNWLIKLLEKNAKAFNQLDNEVLQEIGIIFMDNLIKLRNVNNALKKIVIQWNSQTYTKDIKSVGENYEKYCTSLEGKSESEIITKFDYFDAEFMDFTSDGAIQYDLVRITRDINSQIADGTGLLKSLCSEKRKHTRLTKLKDFLKSLVGDSK